MRNLQNTMQLRQYLAVELSFANQVYGMTPREFKKKEVLPFMTLYCITWIGLMLVAWLNIPFWLQLSLFFVILINAISGFHYFFEQRRNKLEEWKNKVLKIEEPFTYQMLNDYLIGKVIEFLKENNLFSKKKVKSLILELDNTKGARIESEISTHSRGALLNLLFELFKELFQFPTINLLKIIILVISFTSMILISQLYFAVRKALNITITIDRKFLTMLKIIRRERSRKKKNKK
ncbi:MAG: hypothetical protein LBJ04_17765 [Sphingobacterium sp.]|jgi:hypothetical protein|nr:hypothetical protein [Sphingobacterium sp.]